MCLQNLRANELAFDGTSTTLMLNNVDETEVLFSN
jgi:hypothetical protein